MTRYSTVPPDPLPADIRTLEWREWPAEYDSEDNLELADRIAHLHCLALGLKPGDAPVEFSIWIRTTLNTPCAIHCFGCVATPDPL